MAAFSLEDRAGMTIVSFPDPEISNKLIIAQIGEQLGELVASGKAKCLLMNFQGVTFLTSEMLGQLALLNKKCRAAKVTLKLCCLSESVLHVLKLVRLDTLFELVKTVDDAEAAFERENSPHGTKPLDLTEGNPISADQFRSAAEIGNANAQYEMGRCHENGWGVEQDASTALMWYRKAMRQNHAEAQHALANSYAYGIGVSQDYNEALQLYRRAAEQGLASAQYAMGLSYEFGIGVTKNNETAARWYRLAAYQGDTRAKEALEELS
jgi:anti-anti-sigma factor